MLDVLSFKYEEEGKYTIGAGTLDKVLTVK
jgi:hypothetical protein